MKSPVLNLRAILFCAAAVALAVHPALVATAASTIPDPCKLVTVAAIHEVVATLDGAPKATHPKSGQMTGTYTPANGQSYVDVSLHEGDLAAWKRRNGGKNPVALPEFGSDAFVNPDFEDSADLYAKKGSLILRVTMPKGPQSVEAVKAIARKALPRL